MSLSNLVLLQGGSILIWEHLEAMLLITGAFKLIWWFHIGIRLQNKIMSDRFLLCYHRGAGRDTKSCPVDNLIWICRPFVSQKGLKRCLRQKGLKRCLRFPGPVQSTRARHHIVQLGVFSCVIAGSGFSCVLAVFNCAWYSCSVARFREMMKIWCEVKCGNPCVEEHFDAELGLWRARCSGVSIGMKGPRASAHLCVSLLGYFRKSQIVFLHWVLQSNKCSLIMHHWFTICV